MSCVLRAGGKNFDVDAFLEKSPLRRCAVFRGEIRAGKQRDSGFNLDVSRAGFSELPRQIKDAVQFLSQQSVELQRLRTFPGVGVVELDFAIEEREAQVQTDRFPHELLQLLGNLNIELAVSRYHQKRAIIYLTNQDG